MTTTLVFRVIWTLLMLCGALPLRRADGSKLLAVRRRRVTTPGVETDTSRASREFTRASELQNVRSIDTWVQRRSPFARDIDDKPWWLRSRCPFFSLL